jgi:hypothetical protein
MPAQSTANANSIDARRPSKGGAVDGRTLVAKRRRELIEIYMVALGGPAAVAGRLVVDVRRAAELVTLAEAERAKAMRGEPVDLSSLIRIEGAADRAVRRLGIKPGADQPKPKTLAEYAAQRASEKASSGSGGSLA